MEVGDFLGVPFAEAIRLHHLLYGIKVFYIQKTLKNLDNFKMLPVEFVLASGGDALVVASILLFTDKKL